MCQTRPPAWGLNDVVLVGDDSVSGKPNRKVIFSNFVSGVSSRLNLDSSHLQDNSVGSSEIEAGAVGTSEIEDGAVTQDKIADGAGGAIHGTPTEVALDSTWTDNVWRASGYTLPGSAGDDDLLSLSATLAEWVSGSAAIRGVIPTTYIDIEHFKMLPATTAGTMVANDQELLVITARGNTQQNLYVGRTSSNEILLGSRNHDARFRNVKFRIITT